MRRLTVLFALLSVSWLAMPTSSSAQGRPQTREGFFIGFGLGWGSFGVSDGDQRESGASAFLKLGGTLNDRVLLGGESNVWLKEESGVTLSSASVVGFVQFYPSAESGFFVKGGAGFARLELDTGILGTAAEQGWSMIGGLGYDVRLGANFSLSPYGNFVYGSYDAGSTNVWQLGLAVMWH